METETFKKETLAMIQYLKKLDSEQNQLRIQNEILAREALLRGFDPDHIEFPATRKVRKAGSKKSDELQK